jgi:hypothetical protein
MDGFSDDWQAIQHLQNKQSSVVSVFASGGELDENMRMALVFAWLLYCGRE